MAEGHMEGGKFRPHSDSNQKLSSEKIEELEEQSIDSNKVAEFAKSKNQ